MSMEQEDNQAEKLQQLFAEVTNQPIDNHENKEEEIDNDFIEVDVLNLPPRSEVHKKAKQKLDIRLGSPFIRLLSVLILLMIVIILIYFIAGEQILHFFQ